MILDTWRRVPKHKGCLLPSQPHQSSPTSSPYDRHVSPITGRSPVIVLVAKKNIPASKRDGKDGKPEMVNIRWKYPGRALEAHYLTPLEEEDAPPAPDGGGESAPTKRAAAPEALRPGEPCRSAGS
jgi:hypothetical protein